MPPSALPPGVDYLRFLPEIILSAVATLVMVLEPFTSAGRKNALAGLTLAAFLSATAAAQQDLLQAVYHRLDLTDHHRIEHGGDRLGVARDGGAAGDNDRVLLNAVAGQRRDARPPQHVADVEVVQLERQAEGDHRKVTQGSLRLD